MAFITDSALDAALNYIKTNSLTLHMCSTEPLTFAEVATYSLGTKSNPVISGPSNGVEGGRELIVAEFNDGTATVTGIATSFAIVNADALIVTGLLLNPQGVSIGNAFVLSSFSITIPDATQNGLNAPAV